MIDKLIHAAHRLIVRILCRPLPGAVKHSHGSALLS